MLIGAFSKLVKTTVKTLRYYDRIGLFCPSEIDPVTGYRKYSADKLSEFLEIRQYRLAGLSVEQIIRLQKGESRESLLLAHQDELAKQEALLRQQKKALSELLNTPMSANEYIMKIKELPSCTVCTCRTRVPDIAHIPPAFSTRFKEMKQCYPELSLTEPNYCCVTFTDTSHKDADIEVEYAEAVTVALSPKNGFSFKTLSGGSVACVEHYGAYENIADAYAALFRQLAVSSYQAVGAVRERFIHGAWDRKNEADWLIEIQVPIKAQGDNV